MFGRWQDQLEKLTSYTSIFFDTFGEYYDDLSEFNQHVPNILDQSGVYSYFNGLCGTNQFFHDVACKMSEIDLNECCLQVKYFDVEVGKLGGDLWNGTRRAYWNLEKYKVPIVTFESQ